MKLRRVAKIVVIVLMAGGGIGGYLFISSVDAGILDRGSWHVGQDTDTVAVNVSVWVTYPGPVPLDLTSFNASITATGNGITLLRGQERDFRLAQGNNTITQQPTLAVGNLNRWWASHMRNGERTTVALHVRLQNSLPVVPSSLSRTPFKRTIKTNIEERLASVFTTIEKTYSYDSGYPGEEAIAIEETRPRFGTVTRNTTRLLLTLTVRNMNEYPMPAPSFNGSLQLNGITVVSWSRNDTAVRHAPSNGVIAPGATEEITVAIDVANRGIPAWFVSHVAREEYTEGLFTLRLFFDFDEGGLLIVPAGGYRCPLEFATALLVDQRQYTETGDCSSSGRARYTGASPATALGGGDDTTGADDTVDGTTDDGSTDGTDSNGTLDVPLG